MANLNLKVVEKIAETSDAYTFCFENTSGSTVFYKPGQFLTLVLNIGNEEYSRSYSLCTVPVKDKYPAITVKRVQNGLVSNYLIDNIKVGDVVECMYPAGVFHPELDLKNKKEYFLFAAGSGITPLYSILQTILLKEPSSNVNLIYCNRNESTIIYKSKLEELEIQFIDRFKMVHVLSNPSVDWHGFRNRMDGTLARNLIQELAQKTMSDAVFFLCGPSDFMHTCMDTILQMGYEPERIKKEVFGNASMATSTEVNVDGKVKEIKLFHRGKEYDFLVEEGKSILKSALENGIKLPYSCTSGVCTACIGTCLEGEVDISSSDVLSENEKKQGYILTCIGKPISQKVVIQVD